MANRTNDTLGLCTINGKTKTIKVYTDKVNVWKGDKKTFDALTSTNEKTLYEINF